MNLVVDLTGEAYAAVIGERLNSRSDVDSVPRDVAFPFDYVSKMEADPQVDSFITRRRNIELPDGLLDVVGAPNGVQSIREFYEEAVPDCLNFFPFVSRQDWPDQVSLLFENVEREHFVPLTKFGVAWDVREHSRRKLALPRGHPRLSGGREINSFHCDSIRAAFVQ